MLPPLRTGNLALSLRRGRNVRIENIRVWIRIGIGLLGGCRGLLGGYRGLLDRYPELCEQITYVD